MAKNKKVSQLFALIDGKVYMCVPSANCKGCAFENKCYSLRIGNGGPKLGGKFNCPVFNDYTIASDIDFIYKEVKA